MQKSSDTLTFKRADTSYDWFLKVTLIKTSESLENLLLQHLAEKNILLDQPEEWGQTTLTQADESLRVEGTGTRDDSQRIYLDLTFLQRKNGVLKVESQSSVLNGLVEGPFVEAMLKTLKFKPTRNEG